MFGAGMDLGAGIPVVNEVYPPDEAGIQKSLHVMCRKVREGMATAVMKSFAGNVLKEYGFPNGVYNRTAALLDFVRKNVAYAPDALGTEQIQSAAITLCVAGAPVCIPVGDCFPEGTLLLRRDGQLVPIEEIEVGDEIWGQDKWVEVEAKAFKGKLRVDAIELNNGSTVYLTPDHHVYAGRCKHGKGVECPTCVRASQRTESFERIRVSDLQIGDTMKQPERVAFGSKSPDPDRMYIEGLALADGSVKPPHVDKHGVERKPYGGFTIAGLDGKRKEAQKHEVQAICARLGIETRWHRKYITVKDREWGARLWKLGSRARFKRVEHLDLDEAAAAALLRGLMADSTANTNDPGRTYSTTSHTLMVQVRVLHRMFGRSTSVKMLTPEQHRGAGKHPLWRIGVRAPGERADKTLAVNGIERAVKKVPCWDIQTTDHHVYLPEHDVTVSQCDDLVVALATLIAALGMEVRITRQIFGGDHQQHVLLEVKDEKGKWIAADPSSKTMPVGRKAQAVQETYCSPWDSDVTGLADVAQFVGIGSIPTAPLPVMMLTHGAWHVVDHLPQRQGLGQTVLVEIAPGIEVDMRTGDVQVGLGHEGGACCDSCAKGKKCESGCSGEQAGVAGLIEDTSAALKLAIDPVDAAKKLWAASQGKSWDDAIGAADAHAESRSWSTDLQSQADLATLALSSACNVRLLDERNDAESKRASDALTRSFYILLKRIGRAPSAGASVQQYTSGNLTAAAEIPIGIIIVLAIAVAIIYIAFFALIYYVLRDCLSVVATSFVCDREMMRLHSEVDKIVDNRLKKGGSFSADELQRISDLEAAQKRVLDGCVEAIKPPPSSAIPWGTVALVAGLIGATALGVVYAPEIKSLVRGKR